MTRIEKTPEGGMQYSFTDDPSFEHLEGAAFFLPYSDIRMWIPEGDIWFDFNRAFPVYRLHEVKQLSFLSYAGPDPERVTVLQYPHTRFLHTQQVALTAREIVRKNGGDLKSQYLIMTAAGLHDIATPAHGDATKVVDKENLDEEDHWKEMIEKTGKTYLKRHDLSIEQIDEIIHNRDALGQVLDVADRIAYVMQDTQAILGDPFSVDSFRVDPYTAVLRSIIQKDPQVGNIYKDVLVDWKNKRVVFSDVKRLEVFLYLRAHLHQQHYLYPRNQGRDMVVASVMRPFYSNTGDPENPDILTPQRLRRMSDNDLMDFLGSRYGFGFGEVFYNSLLNWHPKFERFENNAEADRRLEEISQEKDKVVLGKREVKPFDPGNKYLVVNGRKIETFEDATGRSMVLKRIVDETRGVFVFYIPKDEEPIGGILQKAKEFLEKRAS